VDELPIGADRNLAYLLTTAQAALLLFPVDSIWLKRFAKSGGTTLLDAQSAAASHQLDDARRIVGEIQAKRVLIPKRDGLGSPDAVLGEARVLLAARDSGGAAAWLDSALAHVAEYRPSMLLKNRGAAGSLIQTMILRADLAAAAGNRNVARRWAEPVLVLWKHSSRELSEAVKRMGRLAALP
jgi:hypothetical protein